MPHSPLKQLASIYRTQLQWQPIVVLLIIAMIWGSNLAFLSYLAWFVLVSRYPVSLLHAFSFFTPVFGVIFSGVLILGETISPNLILALIMVSLGMVLVNYKPTK